MSERIKIAELELEFTVGGHALTALLRLARAAKDSREHHCEVDRDTARHLSEIKCPECGEDVWWSIDEPITRCTACVDGELDTALAAFDFGDEVDK